MPIKMEVKTNKKAEKAINSLKDGYVKVGWFEGQKEPNGLPVAENAYMQNKGFTVTYKNGNSVYVPARPFMQITFDDNAVKWNEFWKRKYKDVANGKAKLKKLLDELGEIVRSDIRVTLRSNVQPKLRESTLKARRSRGNYRTTTLIDSGTMYNSILFKSEVGK